MNDRFILCHSGQNHNKIYLTRLHTDPTVSWWTTYRGTAIRLNKVEIDEVLETHKYTGVYIERVTNE